jgi:hypothetical protein
MSALTAAEGKALLHQIERRIHNRLDELFALGEDLKRIRDDQLYKHDGFTTWEEYCRQRWDWSGEHVRRLIVASEYRAVLPAPPNGGEKDKKGGQWNEACIRELTRIESKRDAARVAAYVVKVVEESAKEAAENPTVKPLKLTAATVRKVVDEELGIDRVAKARETKQEREKEWQEREQRCWEREHPLLDQFMLTLAYELDGKLDKLDTVDAEAWGIFVREQPFSVKKFTETINRLAQLRDRLAATAAEQQAAAKQRKKI